MDIVKTDCVLPEKPSELIRLAMADLAKVEVDPRYKIDMSAWHKPTALLSDSPVCSVCFAGSVMAKTCDVSFEEAIGPDNFPEEQARKFLALDKFRSGSIWSGVTALNLQVPWGMAEEVRVVPYSADPVLFRADMERLADMLERNGL